jgi:phosphosulfolactate phosphohydrolase-like enzyme
VDEILLNSLLHEYKPAVIQTLLVAESPSTGPRFFYLGNSPLFHYTHLAFQDVLGEQVGSGPEFFDLCNSLR